jgi:hypothetical protein
VIQEKDFIDLRHTISLGLAAMDAAHHNLVDENEKDLATRTHEKGRLKILEALKKVEQWIAEVAKS